MAKLEFKKVSANEFFAEEGLGYRVCKTKFGWLAYYGERLLSGEKSENSKAGAMADCQNHAGA